MTDRQEVGGSPGAAHESSTSQWSDPASEAIHAWLNDFARAAKSFRVYAENNEMLNRLVDRAQRGLDVILQAAPELNLSVRADRLLVGKDAVHVNSDREDGLPFILYRNAFRRITFVQGFERSELVEFMRALSTDYTGGGDQLGEDLVAALWRLALPHLRYVTIDALSVVAVDKQSQAVERVEIERIQESVEDIVAAIYRTNAPDDDIVAGVSITKEDLEALRRIRDQDDQDLDVSDHATARIITPVAPEELKFVAASLAEDTRDVLVHRIVDILVQLLFQEPSGPDSAQTIGLIQQLFDSMVLARRFGDATELVERLWALGGRSDNLQEMHIARHLIRMFASEQRILSVVEALEERSASVQDKVRFLRALGPDTRSVLLDSLDNLSQPGHRRLLIELIREFGAPPVIELQVRMSRAKWFVVRDLLSLSQAYSLEEIAPLIVMGLGHEHPKVRQHAVGLLRGYGAGLADKLLAERLFDEDAEVRLAAMRVAAARKSVPCLSVLEEFLMAEDLNERPPKELRTLMAAYAAIGGVSAVDALDRVLNPGFFTRLKGTETQVAAAFALASIGPAAHEALQRGARTLNSKVRDACRRALAPRESDDLPPRESGELPAILLGTPESPPPGASLSDVIDDTETFIGTKVVAGRPLPKIPVEGDLGDGPSRLRIPPDLEEELPDRRERPALPRVDKVHVNSETLPETFSQVRLEAVQTAPEQVPVFLPPPVEDVMPDSEDAHVDAPPSVDDEFKNYLAEMRTPSEPPSALPKDLPRPKVDDLLLDPPVPKGSTS